MANILFISRNGQKWPSAGNGLPALMMADQKGKRMKRIEIFVVNKNNDFMKNEIVEKLNKLESGMSQEKAEVYREYRDHTDDAELCWSQREKEWLKDIEILVDHAKQLGINVRYNRTLKRWI